MTPQPELRTHQPEAVERAPGQMRPDVVGDHEIHDHDRAGEDQVEMAGDPLRVVDRRIELVAHVDDPAGAAKAEHDKGQRYRRASPGCARATP